MVPSNSSRRLDRAGGGRLKILTAGAAGHLRPLGLVVVEAVDAGLVDDRDVRQVSVRLVVVQAVPHREPAPRVKKLRSVFLTLQHNLIVTLQLCIKDKREVSIAQCAV